MPKPLVSIIVPALNAEGFVGAALASVRDQPVADIEVLVVDAGSSDGTVDIVAEIVAADPRFRMVEDGRRLSPPQARNLGLRHARAPLVATLDHDDVMLPNRLPVAIKMLAEYPTAVATGGQLRFIDPAGLPLVPRPRGMAPPTTPAQLRATLPFTCPTLSSAMTYRRQALDAAGGFDEDHPTIDDYPLLWRLTQAGEVHLVDEPVAGYRSHPGQLTHTSALRSQWETVLLRQRIAAAILGRRPPLPVVQAWSWESKDPATETLAEATATAEDIAERCCADPRATDADRKWIRAAQAARATKLQELMARASV